MFIGFKSQEKYYLTANHYGRSMPSIFLIEAMIIDVANLYEFLRRDITTWQYDPTFKSLKCRELIVAKKFSHQLIDDTCVSKLIIDLDQRQIIYDEKVIDIKDAWQHNIATREYRSNINSDVFIMLKKFAGTMMSYGRIDVLAEMAEKSRHDQIIQSLSEIIAYNFHKGAVNINDYVTTFVRNGCDFNLNPQPGTWERIKADPQFKDIIQDYNNFNTMDLLKVYEPYVLTGIEYAIDNGYLPIVKKFFAEHKLTPEEINADLDGITWLGLSCSKYNHRMILLLLEHGADPFIDSGLNLTGTGSTKPMDYFVFYRKEYGFGEIINYINLKTEEKILQNTYYGQLPKDIRGLIREYLQYEV